MKKRDSHDRRHVNVRLSFFLFYVRHVAGQGVSVVPVDFKVGQCFLSILRKGSVALPNFRFKGHNAGSVQVAV